MTEYVKKDGYGACYRKISKKGTPYYNGWFNLDGKSYWLSLFTKKNDKNETYVSFSISPKEKLPEQIDKLPASANQQSDIDDEIPF